VPPNDRVEDLAHVLPCLDGAQHRVDSVRADLVASFDKLDELVDKRMGLGDVLLVALEGQLVPAQPDRAVHALAHGGKHAVGNPGQLSRYRIRDVERFLHGCSVGGATQGPKRVRRTPQIRRRPRSRGRIG